MYTEEEKREIEEIINQIKNSSITNNNSNNKRIILHIIKTAIIKNCANPNIDNNGATLWEKIDENAISNAISCFIDDEDRKNKYKETILKWTESEELSKALIKKIAYKGKVISNVVIDEELKAHLSDLEKANPPQIDWNKYTIRHYTKADPANFKGKIKSLLSLIVEKDILKTGDATINTSGHTTGFDWKCIGNVGDTFYSLFFNGASATGYTPGFINDANYYIEWSVNDFGNCWASSDWLCLPNEATPPSFFGEIKDVIIASLRNQAKCKGQKTTIEGKFNHPQENLQNPPYNNFEIKKHGSFNFKNAKIVQLIKDSNRKIIAEKVIQEARE